MKKDLLIEIEKLTDEKYDWLNIRQEKTLEAGEKFNYESEKDLWYTKKIAELQLIIEKMQNNKKV